MKRFAFIVIVCLCCAGCVQVSGTRSPDGTLTVNTHRFLWASQGIAFTLNEGTNGSLSTTLSVNNSSVDDAALQAIVQGVVTGVIIGLKTP